MIRRPPRSTLSLHDALPISISESASGAANAPWTRTLARAPSVFGSCQPRARQIVCARSEEHTSELQSLTNLVCRLLLEKKKKQNTRQWRSTRAENADGNSFL